MADRVGTGLECRHTRTVGRGPNSGFNEEYSFRSYEVHNGLKPTVYSFDISRFKLWNGPVRHIRIDLEGCAEKCLARLWSVGVSTEPITEESDVTLTVSPDGRAGRAKSERMAAWHQTLVIVDGWSKA